MKRFANILIAVGMTAAVAHAQVPPGDPYNASRHPNPIVTYVDASAFRPSNFADAQEAADIELLGLSQSEGKRVSLDIAETTMRRARVMGRNVDVTFYPVVRQRFELRSGGELVIYSFKNPKSAVPPAVLNEAAFTKPRNPADARFGSASIPERLDVRGSDGLLFEKDGEMTVFWQEDGVSHTATASMPPEDLFRLLDDLL
jgi:hypothetical protein